MKIQLKHSDVVSGSTSVAPAAEYLLDGELAVAFNSFDPKIFFKTSDDTLVYLKAYSVDDDVTAVKLDIARTITLTGDVTGSFTFDGSTNVSFSTTVDGGNSDTLEGSNKAFFRNASNINAGILPSARLSGTYNISNAGNSTTASGLETARSITLTGDVTGTATFDGTANTDITATVADDSHNHTSLTGITSLSGSDFSLQTNVTDVADDGVSNSPYSRLNIDSLHSNGLGVGQSWIEGSNIDFNTTGYIGTGQAGGQTHRTVVINNPKATVDGSVTSYEIYHDNYHPTADALTSPVNIALTGDVTGSVSFDGSTNVSISTTVDGGDADTLEGSNKAFYRNASNLNAGLVPTARLSGTYNIDTSGNAATATALETAREIRIRGDVTGEAAFDGTEAITIDVVIGGSNVVVVGDQVENSSGNWHTFVNDGGGNIGQRWNSTKTGTNRLVEDGHAWELQIDNDSVNGSFTLSRSDTSQGLANNVINWIPAVTIDYQGIITGKGDGLTGVNADLLDGINSTSFLRSDANDTATGALSFSGGLELTSGPGTIAGSNFNNGWLRIGTSSLGWAFDNNELITFGSCIVGSASGSSLTVNARPAFNGGTSGSSSPFTVDSTQVVTNLNADLLDGQQGSFYQNASNLNAGTISDARITDIGDSQARIITFDNLEKSNLTSDGQLGFDSSQGLLVYRAQQGTSGATTTVLDGWNVAAGTNISITNLGSGNTGDTEFTFSVTQGSGSGLDADTVDGIQASSFAQLGGATFTGDLRVDNDADLRIGDGAANERILIQKADNNVSDHIIFYNGTTRIGEIGCQDTTWLRINQVTNKNIYTPRYIRSDGGFFVDGTSKGINGSGNFFGGTIAGASDYGTLLRSNANDTFTGTITGNILLLGGSQITDSSAVLQVNGFQRTGNIILHEGGNTPTAGADGTISNSSGNLLWKGNTVWHAGNDGAGSGLDADTIDGIQASALAPIASPTFTGNITIPGAIVHSGDTNTYIQFHGNDLFRVVINGAEVQEWGNNYTLLSDNDTLRLGSGSDFHMYFNGADTIFRNYAHANGDIIFQGENSSGTNQNILVMKTDGARTYNALYENNEVRFSTSSTGVTVTGSITVTGSVDGRDIAADGTKLDGIETGATADQTATEILNLIKTVDGANSGLDADTLDDQQGSYYRNATNINAGTLNNARLPSAISVSTVTTSGAGTFNNILVGSASPYPVSITSAGAASFSSVTSGDITSSGNLLPNSDNSGNVGTSARTWNNGRFTHLTVDSTLTVRAAIDLADNDHLRFGSSDDARLFYDGTNNDLELELESACDSFIITDNGTVRYSFGKNGTCSLTSLQVGSQSPYLASITSAGVGNFVTVNATTLDGSLNSNNLTGTIDNNRLPSAISVTSLSLSSTANPLTLNAIVFNNTEATGYYTGGVGTLAFDENFYGDVGYGTGAYDPDAVFTTDNGGGLLIKNQDGWGAIFTSQNTRFATATWNGLNVIGDLLPNTDNTGNVGTSDKTWSNGQFTNLTINSTLSVRGAIDLADGDILRFGSSDDLTITYNSNNWFYMNFVNGNGIVFRDNGTDTMILEDSGIFRPSSTNTGTLGTSTRVWNHTYTRGVTSDSGLTLQSAVADVDTNIKAGNNLILTAGTSVDGAIYFRGNSGSDSYRFSKSGQTAHEGFLSFESLTADRTFTFPDTTGTIALTSSTVTNANNLGGIAAASYLRSDANDVYTGTLTGAGSISFSGGVIEIGDGSGSVAMTVNDGYGNANLCFNHASGTPDVNGNSLRIETNVDSTTNAQFVFEGKSNVTANSAVTLNNLFTMDEGGATCLGNTVWHAGNDGSGSGLDADTVDGIQGSSFLRSDTSDTTTGDLTINGVIFCDEIRDRTGSQLVLNAGEAEGKFSGQTGERVYLNSEGGAIISTPDSGHTNFESGYTQDQTYIRGRSIGIKADPGGNLAGRNACLAIGDSDTGVAQNGDGQLELWANNQECLNVTSGGINSYKSWTFDNNNQTGQNSNYNAVNIDADYSGTAAFTTNRSSIGLRVDLDNAKSNTTTTNGNRHTTMAVHATNDNSQYTHDARGLYGFAKVTADGSGIGTQSVFGAYTYAQAYATGGAVNAYGIHSIAYRGGSTSGGTLYGVYGRAQSTTNGSGKSGNAVGGYFEVECDEDTIGNAKAVQAHIDRDAGTITTGYLYYGSYAGTVGTKWGLYITGESKNYFSNNVGIGTDNPTNKLTVSGSASISSDLYVSGTTYFGASPTDVYISGSAINTSTLNATTINTSTFNGTGLLTVSGAGPLIKLDDTDHYSFWLHANSNNFYVLADRNDDGSWDGLHPLQLEADSYIGYVFGERIFNEAYHPNADKLTTARTITLTGHASGSVSFDGSANRDLAVTVNKSSDQFSNNTGNWHCFVNDGGGNIGQRWNSSTGGTNTLIENGIAYRLLIDNDSATGSFYLGRGIGANNAAGGAISWYNDFQIDSGGDVRIAENLAVIGDLELGNNTNSRLIIKKADNNVADHIQFFNGTTRIGEIGCYDNTWLRINQQTNKNIFTPRYIRADGGFFVDGTSKGINGSGNFIGGTIAGASDYGTLLRADAADTSTRMKTFYTNMSSQDDFVNSPISIRERDGAGSGDGEARDAPNLNFHWNGRVSNSLWMNSGGTLNWGSYNSTGEPAFPTDGTFTTGNIYAVSLMDCATLNADTINADTFIGPASNTEAIRVRSSSYNSKYLYIGGWSSANSDNIARIRTSGNLHIDSPKNGDLYLNWHSQKEIHSNGNLRFQDNKELRLGSGADFRMDFNGADTIFRSFAHANGDIIFQGETSGGTNQSLLIMKTDGARTYNILYENGGERFRTTSVGAKISSHLGINTDPGNNLAARAAGIAVGDADTGIAQNGDGKLELWANNTVTLRCQSDRVFFNHGTRTRSNMQTGLDESGVYGANNVMFEATHGTTNGGTALGGRSFLRANRAADTTVVFEVKVGTNNKIRFRSSGDGLFDGGADIGNADYAEYFEWEDGNPDNEDRRGIPVVLVEDKIRMALPDDDINDIIGVISAAPGVVGDSAEMGWHQSYLKDEYGSKITNRKEYLIWSNEETDAQPASNTDAGAADQKREITENFPDDLDDEVPSWAITNNIRGYSDEQVQNPDYDPNREYVPRSERPEWDPVGLMGKLVIRNGLPVNPKWKRMKAVNDTLSKWLVM
jgi:hypothetical protein